MTNPYGSDTPDNPYASSNNPGQYPGSAGGFNPAQQPGETTGQPYGAFPNAEANNQLQGGQAASAGIRLGAFVIDALLVGIVGLLISMLLLGGDFMAAFRAAQNGNDNAAAAIPSWKYALDSILGVVIWFAYRVGMETGAEGTLGKKILGLKVIGEDGGKLPAGRSFIRNIWYLIAALPSTIASIAQIAIMIVLGVTLSRDARHQHQPDKWAKALVVRK
ncbi:RDD family protein [Corynebacterium heidelbergense]|uniref:RDD domain-containing protein n=1 Tax=Corynebacterium heidelbergense TaxID=2055947 RepID=A0A364VBF7_9CORY|nr:RDD family protein [Corynebacterium heidelbergense]RAV33985.1 hypothetical protein CWC39_05580 [Corynebacterium heidelbergense]WCZ37141.1 RDD family protein [Corynebacterium heidelbergense]